MVLNGLPGVKGYLSLPANDEQIHLEGTEDGSFNLDEKYILECENELSDPVSVILHGENGKYYRVLLLDEESEPLRSGGIIRIILRS